MTDSRKLARAIEKRLHLIADPSIRKDMAALCEHLKTALDERDARIGDLQKRDKWIQRLQAENERLRSVLIPHNCSCSDCRLAQIALKDNHGKQ